MIIPNDKAVERLDSPLNLINRLRKHETGVDPLDIFKTPAVGPDTESDEDSKVDSAISIDKLIKDADSQIQLASAHDKAVRLMNTVISEMELRVNEVKPEKLPAILTAASKLVTDLRREQLESAKLKNGRDVHLHFYTPVQKTIEQYDVIEVG